MSCSVQKCRIFFMSSFHARWIRDGAMRPCWSKLEVWKDREREREVAVYWLCRRPGFILFGMEFIVLYNCQKESYCQLIVVSWNVQNFIPFDISLIIFHSTRISDRSRGKIPTMLSKYVVFNLEQTKNILVHMYLGPPQKRTSKHAWPISSW